LTSNYTTATATPASAANAFGTSLAFTADGTSSYIIEIYASRMQTSATSGDFISVILFDVGGSTAIGSVGFLQTPTSGNASAPFFTRIYITPTAGSKTYNLRFVHGTASGTIYAANGGTGGTSHMPIAMAVYGPPLT
jgi:hypothetical protein